MKCATQNKHPMREGNCRLQCDGAGSLSMRQYGIEEATEESPVSFFLNILLLNSTFDKKMVIYPAK